MPTKLTRYILSFSDAQLDDLRLRFPDAVNDKAAIYEALGFDRPKRGGDRPGTGRPPGSKSKKARRKKLKARPE